MSNSFHTLKPSFKKTAETLDRIDTDVYREYGRDPLDPIIGMGTADLDICVFGRDPGRHEVDHQIPFIGAGGQKVRNGLYRHRHGCDLPDFQSSLDIGHSVFWANTVPYKPIGNKAWSEKVKKQFQPLMARVLLQCWQGHKVLTLGREAFLWFAIGQSRDIRADVKAFWASETRFEDCFRISLSVDDHQRTLTLYPLPHPSPLNATWYTRFPDLLQKRLTQMGYGRD